MELKGLSDLKDLCRFCLCCRKRDRFLLEKADLGLIRLDAELLFVDIVLSCFQSFPFRIAIYSIN